MNKEIKLKPCPFCGGEAKLNVCHNLENVAYNKSCKDVISIIRMSYNVKCSICGTGQPQYYHTDIVLKTNGDVDIICDNRQQAADVWNTRANDYK